MIYLSDDLSSKKYDCNECRKYKRYLSVNCDGSLIPKQEIRDENVRFPIMDITVINYCPALLLYDTDVADLLEEFALYKDGHLQREGGIENQDYDYIKAMLELKSAENKLQQIEMERANNG